MQVDSAAPPALYDAVVAHARHGGVRRAFRYRQYLWLVDLDRLPRLPWWLRPFARFRAADHLGSPEKSIRRNLDDWLAEQGVCLDGGQVLMLTNARVLGYVFNPLSVFWCHRPGGELACVVAEVHNTYGERHCYLLRPDTAGRASASKRFYVSPFLPEDGDYEMHLPAPDDRLRLLIQLRAMNRPLLTATVAGSRRAATTRTLLGLLLRRPLVPQRVSLAIRRQGIALWLRRVPIVPRPKHTSQGGAR